MALAALRAASIALKVSWPLANHRTFRAVQKIAVFTLGSAVRMWAVGCNQHHSGNQLPFVVVLVHDTTKRSGVIQEELCRILGDEVIRRRGLPTFG